jgi:glutamine synthetase
VDRHADLLRASAANPGNDHRLGANEAPPAIISIFMGEELTDILESLGAGKKAKSKGQHFLKIGVDSLPDLPKDNTDRNRTSPFAFTGNKFEFRMVPSSASISGPNIVLNTIVAEALDEIATRLEKAKNINQEAQAIVKEAVQKHGRIIFNGNNYAEDWVKEAKKRGLPNIKSTVEALDYVVTPKATKLFGKYKVLSKEELHSRYEVYLEQYVKCINIEAQAAINMVNRQYNPTVIRYTESLAETIGKLKAVSASSKVQSDVLKQVSALLEADSKKLSVLESATKKAQAITEVHKKAVAYRDEVMVAMKSLREEIDALETIVPSDIWPVPTYAEMLFKL